MAQRRSVIVILFVVAIWIGSRATRAQTQAFPPASGGSIGNCTKTSGNPLTCTDGFDSDDGSSTGYVRLRYGSAPANPASGKMELFWDASKVLKDVDSAGTVRSYTPGGGGGGGLLWMHTGNCSTSSLLVATTTMWCGWTGWWGTNNEARVPVGATGTMKRLYVQIFGYINYNEVCVVTLNGSDTGLTVTMAGNDNAIYRADTTHTASVTAGDYINLKCTAGAETGKISGWHVAVE